MKDFMFIKIKGLEANNTGYFVPHMHKLVFCWPVLKTFGLKYLKARLTGWTVWYVSIDNYVNAELKLDELKKSRIFDYEVY